MEILNIKCLVDCRVTLVMCLRLKLLYGVNSSLVLFGIYRLFDT